MDLAPRSAPAPGAGMTRPVEVTGVHTRILRCTLAVPDARSYWGER